MQSSSLPLFLLSALLVSILALSASSRNDAEPTASPSPPGYNFSIETTWNNLSLTYPATNFSFNWNVINSSTAPERYFVRVVFTAPYFHNPPPPNPPGPTPGLFNYEVVELFFANDQERYVEIEIGPHRNWLIYFFKGPKDLFTNGTELLLIRSIKTTQTTWTADVEIPLAYLPPNVTTFNAYGIHDANGTRQYEAFSPTPYGEFSYADFHRLKYFAAVNTSEFIPVGMNYKPVFDPVYGGPWTHIYN